MVHRWIRADNIGELGELNAQCLKRYVLVRLNHANQAAGVLLWEEALRNGEVEINSESNGRERYEQHQRLVLQDPRQRSFVEVEDPLESAFAQMIQAAVGKLA